MKRTKVQSSNVEAVGYSKAKRLLEVAFLPQKEGQTAAVYQYRGVPPEVAAGLKKADSVGKYLAKHVKGVYPFERVK